MGRVGGGRSGILSRIWGRVKWWWAGLRIQAILWTVVPLVLMLFSTVGLTYYTYQQVAQSLAQSRDQELASASADRLSESISSYVRSLTTLSNLDVVRSDNPSLQSNAIIQASDILSVFDGGVMVINAAGLVTVTEPFRPDLLGRDFSNKSYFQNTRALRRFTFSDIIQEESTGEDIIVIAVPIFSPEDEFIGVIASRFYVRFQTLGEEIRKLRVGEQGDAFLVDRNGRVIYHPDSSMIGEDLSNERVVYQLMRGERRGALVVGSGKEKHVVGYAIVDVTGWGLITREPWEQVVGPTRRSLGPILMTLIIGVLIVALFISGVVQRVVSPIAELARQTRHVAAGEYNLAQVVNLSDIREINELGRSFNDMVREVARYQAGMRQYLTVITDSQEDERKRIARDLHDDTVQSLIAIGQRIELARETMKESPEKGMEQLRELRVMITDTIDSVRQFSRDLRPLALEDLGLIAALQYQVNQLSQRHKIEATLEVQDESGADAPKIPPEMEVAIYRILQEALTNARKHSRASRVRVCINFTRSQITLTIEDNGVGFEVPESITELANYGNFGLMGLQERAQLFGGHVMIDSSPGEGTRLKITIPREMRLLWIPPSMTLSRE